MSDKPWTWDWSAVAAVGTAAAALLSVFAIIVAALAARASGRAATAAERQLAAQTMPVVVEVPRGFYFPEGKGEPLLFPDGEEMTVLIEADAILEVDEFPLHARCSIPIQNIGSGIARVTRAYLDFQTTTVEFLESGDAREHDERPRARPTHIWIPAGGRTRLMASVPKEDEANMKAIQWAIKWAIPSLLFVEVRIRYSDASGTQSFATLLHLRRGLMGHGWQVYQQWTRPVSE